MKPSLTNFDDVYGHSQQPFNLRGDDSGVNGARVADLGELEQSAGIGFLDAVNLSRIYNGMKASNVSVVCNNSQFGGFTNSLVPSGEMGSSGGGVDTVQCTVQKGGTMGFGGSNGSENIENWGDMGVVADRSQQRETSTDTDDKILVLISRLSLPSSILGISSCQEFPCLVILKILSEIMNSK